MSKPAGTSLGRSQPPLPEYNFGKLESTNQSRLRIVDGVPVFTVNGETFNPSKCSKTDLANLVDKHLRCMEAGKSVRDLSTDLEYQRLVRFQKDLAGRRDIPPNLRQKLMTAGKSGGIAIIFHACLDWVQDKKK